MKTMIVAMAAAALVAGCGVEDPEVTELQALMGDQTPVGVDAPTRERLNHAFARQAVRASSTDAAEWAPLVKGDATPVAASPWVQSKDIDDAGRFSPSGSTNVTVETPPAPFDVLMDEARAVAAALQKLVPDLKTVKFQRGLDVAVRFSADGTEATVNPRLLELLAKPAIALVDAAPAATGTQPVAQKPAAKQSLADRAISSLRGRSGPLVLKDRNGKPLGGTHATDTTGDCSCCGCGVAETRQHLLAWPLALIPAGLAFAFGRWRRSHSS